MCATCWSFRRPPAVGALDLRAGSAQRSDLAQASANQRRRRRPSSCALHGTCASKSSLRNMGRVHVGPVQVLEFGLRRTSSRSRGSVHPCRDLSRSVWSANIFYEIGDSSAKDVARVAPA
ncbi:uncharacterized protein LOC110434745 isoform X2 [Sorghum bicolor]|uniref:Uncharacterized protein n=1 Tax=Sorghum bicolor TaxID=4558 RepID=A0A1B6QH13_SORBI|nr:uncharacterized protein LOC110434745 isoform X2 [Sorghum bicolor]KXG37213.1 hypothetical protein SORBI_3001G026600 [Sorghum bicolor]|eukprot:XP_021315142.1 uncharacterized protein LOC110434745 isoform X2 [Sorghum bicolor]